MSSTPRYFMDDSGVTPCDSSNQTTFCVRSQEWCRSSDVEKLEGLCRVFADSCLRQEYPGARETCVICGRMPTEAILSGLPPHQDWCPMLTYLEMLGATP